MGLIKSKERVADHGEVFTPQWLVEAMLNLVKDETERIDVLRGIETAAVVKDYVSCPYDLHLGRNVHSTGQNDLYFLDIKNIETVELNSRDLEKTQSIGKLIPIT